MNSASNYRDRANHLRQLAEMTWQDDLEALLHRAAHDYDEVADDLEAGCTEIRAQQAYPRIGFPTALAPPAITSRC
jgi:hypothetical protein